MPRCCLSRGTLIPDAIVKKESSQRDKRNTTREKVERFTTDGKPSCVCQMSHLVTKRET